VRFYFDHNACTPVDERVLARFLDVEAQYPGNPGSLHESGRKARSVVEQAREEVARALGVPADEVLFVSGGTEANNMIVLGAGDLELPVLLAPVEHPSVLEAAAQRGHVLWEVDKSGAAVVAPPDSEQGIGLVCLVHGQNEVGTLQPVVAAAVVARDLGAPLHVDASQTLGRCPVADVIGVAASVTLSTHKAGGLRGSGVLICRNQDLRPLLWGGGQQQGRRPGTESPALAAASALAVTLAVEEQPARSTKMLAARAAFAAELPTSITWITPKDNSLPNTLMCLFEGIDGRVLLPALDMAGIEASQGSACSSGSPTPPLVLRAMGLDDQTARACVRFSFSDHTTTELASRGGRVVHQVISRLLNT
jgi:cysteine desulfurase